MPPRHLELILLCSRTKPLFTRQINTTDKHEGRVLCNPQHGLIAVNSWCERWNTRINPGKINSVSPQDLKPLTKYYN
jgi:hypothetical protein